MDAQVVYTHPPILPPRKRKRLAKACMSCHKAKRRCDGHNPCYNCQFTGKGCVYQDAKGNVVPAPNQRRESSASDSGSQASASTESVRPLKRGRLDDWGTRVRDQNPPAVIQPSVIFEQDLGIDPLLCRELINLFFTYCHPHNTMLHRPTFIADVAAGRVPRFLLNAILALAAPLSTDPYLRATPDAPNTSNSSTPSYSNPDSPPNDAAPIPQWHIGDHFAKVALADLVDSATGDVRFDQFAGYELEVAQSLCAVSFYLVSSRRPDRTYFKESLDLLTSLGVPEWDAVDTSSDAAETKGRPSLPPVLTNTAISPRAQWRKRECFRRTLWVVYFWNMTASAISLKSIRFRELDVKIFLPVDEGLFDFDIETTSMSESTASASSSWSHSSTPIHSRVAMDRIKPAKVQAGEFIQYPEDASESLGTKLIQPAETFRPGKMYVSEFGHLLRVTVIYSTIMGCLGQPDGRDPAASKEPFATYHTYIGMLQRWKSSLPQRLRYNKDNLKMHSTNLRLGTSPGSWSWALMHGFAHCSVLALHDLLELRGEHAVMREHVVERNQAYYDNITLLDYIGSQGRLPVTMGMLLIHTGPPLLHADRDTISWVLDGNRLASQFWTEYESVWGMSAYDLCSLKFRQTWAHTALNASPDPGSASPPSPPASQTGEDSSRLPIQNANTVTITRYSNLATPPSENDGRPQPGSSREAHGFSYSPPSSVPSSSVASTPPREAQFSVPPTLPSIKLLTNALELGMDGSLTLAPLRRGSGDRGQH